MKHPVTWKDVKNARSREAWVAAYEQYLIDNFQPSRIDSYGTGHELHIFEPAAKERPTSALLCIPGGGFKNAVPRRMYPICKMFADQGMLTACNTYTTLAGTQDDNWHSVIDPAITDTQEAVLALRRQVATVGAFGVSAGGALALGAGNALNADAAPDFLSLICPAVFAVSSTPRKVVPTQIQHGTKDSDVDIELVRHYVKQLQLAGFECEATYYEGASHFVDFEHWTQVHDRIHAFLTSLKLIGSGN